MVKLFVKVVENLNYLIIPFKYKKGPNCDHCKFVLNEIIMKCPYQIILCLIQSTIILASFNINNSI